MAFTQQSFATIGAQANNSPKLYSYQTDDTQAQTLATDYFIDKVNQLTRGDLINILSSDVSYTGIVQADKSTVLSQTVTPSLSISEDVIPIGDGLGNILDSSWSVDSNDSLTDGTYTLIKNPANIITVNSNADIDDIAVGNVVTISTPTSFYFNVSYTGLATFSVDAGATVLLHGVEPTPSYIYTGNGTFFSGEGSMEVKNINLQSTNSATMCNTTGSGYFSIEFLSFFGWSDLGTISKNGRVTFRFCSLLQIGTGFDVINADVEVLNLKVLDGTVTGPMISLSGNRVAAYTASGIKFLADAGASIFRIDPAINSESRFNMAQTSLISGSAFDTSGTTGAFTAVADASIGSTAVSVIDSPVTAGIARFTFTGPTLYVGQDVITTGFTTNTAYNGTLHIVDTDGTTYFEALFIDYGTDESATFTANIVTMTDTGTSLIDGDTLTILTTNNLDYDGGATVFNQQTNTFQISREFIATDTGVWSTKGLDHSDPRVIAVNNPGFPDSTTKIELSVEGNVVETDIPAAGARVIIASSDWIATSQERMKLLSPDQSMYTGTEPVSVKLDGNVFLEPASSTKTLSTQFVRHDLARVTVTFTNGTNLINETGHSLLSGQNITFHDNSGTLPAELREDIIYYVINPNANDFQVAYTSGGSAIAFTDNGTGTNSYALADLHGSNPKAPIAANSPQTLVPQALEDIANGDQTFLVVSNEDDAVDITVTDGYYRVAK